MLREPNRYRSFNHRIAMWCKSCRQDVPGIASLDEGAFHCARCGTRVGRRRTSIADAALAQDVCDQGINLEGNLPEPSATEALHQWAEDEHLENVRRLLRPVSTGIAPTGMQPMSESPRLRFDPPASHTLRVALPEAAIHTLARPNQPFATRPMPVVKINPAVKTRPSVVSGTFTSIAWMIVSVGMMGLVCGGVLMGWSMATGRLELWKLGLPTLITGYCVLSFGLLVAYFSKRYTHNLRVRAATEQGLPFGLPVQGSSAVSKPSMPYGYPVAADAAATPALLAELRGQLDRLSTQVSANTQVNNRLW